MFGCIALNRGKYCILNKQYTQEEYEALLPKIISHMGKTGEWGEFFPASLSPWAYNETVAQEYMPITREEAIAKNYKWKEKDQREYKPSSYKVQDGIRDVPDSIVNEILACADCGKNYRLIPAEVKLYKQINVPIPRKCPDCRHADRTALRTPRKLWKRKCSACGNPVQTASSPERPEKIYCEKCYRGAVYE